MNRYSSIALVDLNCTLVRAYMGRPKDSDSAFTAEKVMRELAEIRRSVEHVVVCLDRPPYWRAQEYPEYKAQRKTPDLELNQVKRDVREMLDMEGYSVAQTQGFEADDLCATLAKAYYPICDDIQVHTADKDGAQLVNDRVSLKRGGVTCDRPWVLLNFGVEPEMMPMLQALMGDKSDNIPGVHLWGLKTAQQELRENPTIEALNAKLAALATSAKPVPAIWRYYAERCDKLPLYLKLVTLRTDAPIDPEALLVKRTVSSTDSLCVEILGAHRDMNDIFLKDEPPAPEDLAEEAEVMAEKTWEEPLKDGEVRTIDTQGYERTPETQKQIDKELARDWVDVANAAAAGKPYTFPKEVAATSAPSAAGATVVPPGEGPPKPKPSKPKEIDSIVVADRPAPPSWALALQPSTAAEALQVAEVLYKTRFYSQYGDHRAVYTIISMGRELGMGIATALESFHIVKERPFMKANAFKALAEKHPDCEWIMVTSADKESATIKTKHRKIPDVLEYTYTADRARAAGFFTGVNKHNWTTITQEMLEARATSKAVRRWYPAAVMGMISEGEASDVD